MVKHPARYNDEILAVMADLITTYGPTTDGPYQVLDPFAGTGRIHELTQFDTYGIEIEPEWAEMHPRTMVGNALDMPWRNHWFDVVATSPTYGNRMADKHDAKDGSVRRSYKHDLGRNLHSDNSGGMQWGDAYQGFHVDAWKECTRVVRRDGLLVLNIKDHIRGGKHIDVAGWHIEALSVYGWTPVAIRPVVTSGMGMGRNGNVRVPAELVIAFKR